MNADKELQAVLDIGIALSKEKNRNHLFAIILEKSMDICNCDGGTLYLYEDGKLAFHTMKTLSQCIDKGGDGEPINLPPVPLKEENICAYAAIHGKPLNIANVYDSDMFDFSGPKKYDAMTGYHTESMMAIPLVNDDNQTVGVLQLINAMNDDGAVIPFSDSLEKVVYALASQTAIAITNMRYQEELKTQMWSFTEAMAEAIDARTPYNASHTRNVAKYCGLIADYINKLHEEGVEDDYFPVPRKEQLVMGALLHDIGKLVIPLEVMNKATRLDGREESIYNRLEKYALKAKIQFLEGKTDEQKENETLSQIDEAISVIKEVNAAGFLNDEVRARLEKVLAYTYSEDGEELPFFTEEDKTNLRVIKGTLTEEEREIMESHVAMTERILSKVHFIGYFKDSPTWAVQHHECLNGKGYPKGLGEAELRAEARIVAVADICDALLATDRPYKKPLPKEKAFAILRNMAADGSIEAKYVEYLYKCIDE